MPSSLPQPRPSRRNGARLAVLLVLGACSKPAPPPPPSPPLGAGMNVLLITIDTTRADALSCYGGDPRNTPELDRFAAQSARFDVAYSATNTTCPSHLSIMTGLRLIQHRVFENKKRMDPRLETLPLAFQRAGYETAGFPAVPFLGEPFGWPGFEVLASPSEYTTAEVIRKRLLGWLNGRDAARPFFAWAHFYDPHTLYAPPENIAREYYSGDPRAGDAPLLSEQPFLQRWDYPAMQAWLTGLRDPLFPRSMYAGEVHFVDRQISRVLQHLERTGLAERTIVVITADHGESLGEHGIFYAHSGLFETTIRVPLIVHVPGLAPHVVRDTPVSALDLAPTLAELCAIPWPAKGEGLSLVPLLRATEPDGRSPVERRDVLVHEGANNGLVAVRKGDWKLIWPIAKDFQRMEHTPHLFDLASDPTEQHDLYSERPEIAAELRELIHPWIELGNRTDDEAASMDEDVLRELEALGYAR